MTDKYIPKKKMLWFTSAQLKQLEELKELTGLDNSKLVRKAMEMMFKELKEVK